MGEGGVNTYIIYEQRPPIPNGRKVNRVGQYDASGEYEDCSANLVAIGHVTALSNDDAWAQAKRMIRKPVLEEIKQ